MNKRKSFKHTTMTSEIGLSTLPFQAISEPSNFGHKCFIQSSLDTPEDFINCIDVISSAKPDELVIVYLTSCGGSLSAVDCLLMEMADAKERGVRILVKGSGTIASAATLILLEATEFYLSPHAEITLHSASFSYGGKMQDVKEYVDFTFKQCRKLLEDYYTGILTPEEIDDMIINKREILMTSEEFSNRFMKYQEVLQKQMEEQMISALEDQQVELPTPEELLSLKTKKDIVNKLTELGLCFTEGEDD